MRSRLAANGGYHGPGGRVLCAAPALATEHEVQMLNKALWQCDGVRAFFAGDAPVSGTATELSTKQDDRGIMKDITTANNARCR